MVATTAAAWWSPDGEHPSRRELETSADKRRYVETGFAPIACASCGTRVLVRKNSEFQTSMQWTSDPLTSCVQFAAAAAAGTRPAQFVGCSALRQSIADAFAAGRLSVADA